MTIRFPICMSIFLIALSVRADELQNVSEMQEARVMPVTPTGPDLVRALPGYDLKPKAAKFHFGNTKVAFCLIGEANYHKDKKFGSTVERVRKGILASDSSLVLIAIPEPPRKDASKGPGMWHPVRFCIATMNRNFTTRNTDVHFFKFQEAKEGSGREFNGLAHFCKWVQKPINAPAGKIVTLWQLAVGDSRASESHLEPYVFSKPLDRLKALPPIKEGSNNIARVTLQIMFMDPSWDQYTKQVKDFFEKENVIKRLTEGR